MQKVKNNRGFLIGFLVVFFVFVGAIFCSCGGAPEPEKEVIPENVSEVGVSYGDIKIPNNVTFDIKQKSDGNIDLRIDDVALDEHSLDWSKLSAYYKLEGGEDELAIPNISSHLKVYYVDGESEVLIQDMPNLNRVGKYRIVISYNKQIEFTVLVSKQSTIGNLSLSFKEQNKIAENSYEFEYGTMQKSDYRAMIGDQFSINYGFANVSVNEYKEAVSKESVDVSEVNIEYLGHGVGTPTFDELTFGEWFVAVYIEEAGFNTVWSNVCYLNITQGQSEIDVVPMSVGYQFNTANEYQNNEITLAGLFESQDIALYVLVDGEKQSLSAGSLGEKRGSWSFASKSSLESFVATDGTTVLEENILSDSDNLIAETNKYVALKFDYENENYRDALFLVNLNIQKGEVCLPDGYWIGNAVDSTDLTPISTYCGILCDLKYSYANNMDYYESYYDVSNQTPGYSGTLSFTLKNSNRYKFMVSTVLSGLVAQNGNYKNVSYNQDRSSVSVEWALNPLTVSSSFAYQITDQQNKDINEDVVSAVANVVINLSATNLEGRNVELPSLFEYAINDETLAAGDMTINENTITIPVTISEFSNDIYEAQCKISVKDAYDGKAKLLIHGSETANERTTMVQIEKFEITNQKINVESFNDEITLNSVQTLSYVKKLAKYYNISWTIDGTDVNAGDRLNDVTVVLNLTPINSFFVKPLDENYEYCMAYLPASKELYFYKHRIVKNITVTYSEPVVVEKDANNVIQKINVVISFHADGLDSIVYGKDDHDNDLYIVDINLSDDEYASIETIALNDATSLLLTISLTNFDEYDIAQFGVILGLKNMTIVDGYQLATYEYIYYIYKFDV